MKKYKSYVSIALVSTLLISPFGNVIHAQKMEENSYEQRAMSDVSNFQIEDEKYGTLDIKTVNNEENVITEIYNGSEFISRTILHKIDGKIEEFDNLGNKQISNIDDYVKITDTEDIESPETELDDNNPLT
ncbi:hypothetical protein [Metasolibacillus meyeri]|uniref:hypothetical protein n=1 Tax=Metasolibacillus meyeri TaxID=1071052 RepID=UPI0012902002|nr:hypothetical protein [Metasolibacillus meyeri]